MLNFPGWITDKSSNIKTQKHYIQRSRSYVPIDATDYTDDVPAYP